MLKPIHILLVEDNPGDADLTKEGLEDSKIKNDLHVVTDGLQAIQFLRRQGEYANAPRPDLILLDLNMPKMDGREVLAEVKEDPRLKTIPVCVLTSSEAEIDVARSYQLHANCYIAKPVDLEGMTKIVKNIQSFWLQVVKLPPTHET